MNSTVNFVFFTFIKFAETYFFFYYRSVFWGIFTVLVYLKDEFNIKVCYTSLSWIFEIERLFKITSAWYFFSWRIISLLTMQEM